MPIGSTNIKMSSIANEKQGTELPQAAQNISLKGLSVDGVNDFQYVGGAFTDIAGTPDGNAPYGMGEFNGFSGFSWGTPGTPVQNTVRIFNFSDDSQNAAPIRVATTCVIRHIVASKKITFYFLIGDASTPSSFTTDQKEVTYTGTLSTLEARFKFNTMDINVAAPGGSASAGQAFAIDHQLNAQDVSGSGSGGSDVDDNDLFSDGNNQTFNSNFGTLGVQNNIDKSIMLYVTADGTSNDNQGAQAFISSGNAGTITVQLRANGSKMVNLYARSSGAWGIQADSFDDDTT